MMLAIIKALTLRAARLASLPERLADSDMMDGLVIESLNRI